MDDAIATAREAFRAYEAELRRLRERTAALAEAVAEAVAERDRAEIRVQQLGEALRRLFDATHAYLNTGSDPGGPAARALQEALAAAYEALHLDRF